MASARRRGEIRVGRRQGDRGWQAAGDLGGETGAREHRRRGGRRGLGQHLGHQLQRALLDALGAEDHRRSRPHAAARGVRIARRCCAGVTARMASAASSSAGVSGGRDRRFQRDAGQEQRIAPSAVDRLDHLRLARPDQRLEAGAGADLGQRRAPGAASQHPDPLHARFSIRPWPPCGPAHGWVGRGRRPRPAASAAVPGRRDRRRAPAASRSAPASAIMAALSVQ